MSANTVIVNPVTTNVVVSYPAIQQLVNVTAPISNSGTATAPIIGLTYGSGLTLSTGSLVIDGTVVPLLASNNTFAGTNTFGSTITVPTPVNPTDAATKAYVDATAQGLNVKQSVTAMATTNITLTGTQTIDGIALVAGKRVLLNGQTTASQNGLWVVQAGAWTRPVDFASGSTQQAGDFVLVEAGTVNASSGWVMQGSGAIIVDTTANNWTQFSGAGEIIAGAGIVKTGNTLSVDSSVVALLAQANVFTFAQTAPSFIPQGAGVPVNGMYQPATNTVGLAAGSVSVLQINGAGQIGAPAINTSYALRMGINLTGSTTMAVINLRNTVQSDVTGQVDGYYSQLQTAVAAFTLTTLNHFHVAATTLGAGSAITNQFGFVVDSGMTQGTFNYGFTGSLAASANNYNLYMVGTAQNYLAGATTVVNTLTANSFIPSSATIPTNGLYLPAANTVGIATASTARLWIDASGNIGTNGGTNAAQGFRMSKNITGGVTAYGAIVSTTILSDVTTQTSGYGTFLQTQAAAFTLPIMYHYAAFQGTIGAGSAVTTQAGFYADSSITGATNNIGFYGNIPAGTNRYNLFMNGTAPNYLQGALGLATQTLTGIALGIGISPTGATVTYGINQSYLIQSDVTSSHRAYYSAVTTAAAAFTLTTISHFYINTSNPRGAGSAVTNEYGYRIETNMVGATNNYGFFGAIPANTGATVTAATGDGTTVTYTAANTFSAGQVTSITGLGIASGASLNLTSVIINSASSTQFTVLNAAVGVSSGTGTATVVRANWNLYMTGTAPNYLAGGLGIGTNPITNALFSLGGNAIIGQQLNNTVTGAATAYGIANSSVIASDVTSSYRVYQSQPSTQAAAFTLPILYHYWARFGTLGAGSAITNQYGFIVESTLGGANSTNTYAFAGQIAAATNQWNLYMSGTANNYVAGSLGIGDSSVMTGLNLSINKNITGSTSPRAVLVAGVIQSDATSNVLIYGSFPSTVAAAFTLGTLTHFSASFNTLGAGSALTLHQGFQVSSSLANGTATNIYGFRGQLAAGTGIWNLYMDGSATNYLGGALGIGTTSLTAQSLTVSLNLTGATTATGITQNGIVQSGVTTLAQSFNSVMNTQATAFTLINFDHFAAQQGTKGAGSGVSFQAGFHAYSSLTGGTTNYAFLGEIAAATGAFNIFMSGNAANYMAGITSIGTSNQTMGVGAVAQQFGVLSAATTTVTSVFRAASAQVADLMQLQTNGAVALVSITASGIILDQQPTPSTQNATATLTIANILTGIIHSTSATAVTLTLPTGTLMDAGFNSISTGQAFDWSIINDGSASGAVTLAAGTAHTIVGGTSIPINSSARFTSTRTAANTWVTYRIS